MNNLQFTINNKNSPKAGHGGYSRTLISALFRFCEKSLSKGRVSRGVLNSLLFRGETKKAAPNSASGYTLIELMVAVTLFTLVAMASISSLISLNDANKKAQTMRSILDNLNFAAENMARNLRVGNTYYCGESLTPQPPLDCAISGAAAISFSDYEGKWVVYRFNSSKENIERFVGGVGPLPLTPENPAGSLPESNPLSVTNLRFYVSGATSGDGKQPRIVIVVDGMAVYSSKIQTNFEIQTSVSERKIDS